MLIRRKSLFVDHNFTPRFAGLIARILEPFYGFISLTAFLVFVLLLSVFFIVMSYAGPSQFLLAF